MERAIDTQRLRLLRLVAGLLVAVGILSVGPVSRGFSIWACEFVGSILSRAEVATRYLVVAQARRIAALRGGTVEMSRFSVPFAPEFPLCETQTTVRDLRLRLRALQAVLTNLPRHALRLMRRIGKRRRSGAQVSPRPSTLFSGTLFDWRLAGIRIERPPDSILCTSFPILPPSGFRAGGEGSCPIRF